MSRTECSCNLFLLPMVAVHFYLNSIASALTCSPADLPVVHHGYFVCDGHVNTCILKCNYGFFPSSAIEINCARKRYLPRRDLWERKFTCTECNRSPTFSVSWGDNDYLFVKTDHTWSDAYKMCQLKDQSAHLAAIESREENAFIHTILYQCVNESHVWIGLNDRDHEGNWKWSTTTASYFNWGKAGPTVSEPDGGRDENCVVMSRSTGGWHDVACEWPRFAVCERQVLFRKIPVK